MIKLTWILVLLISSTFSFAQSIDNIIDASEATRIVKQLAGDEMKGRKTFSPTLTRTKFLSASGTINDT